MPEFQAILFDFDGVLLDSEPVHWACWAEELEALGVTLTWDFYRQHCIGIDDREMLRMMASQSDPPRDWRELWTLYPAKKERFRERMVAHPAFDPALDGLLARLHERYKLAVVSSSSSSEIEPLLIAGGLRGHFDTVVGGEQVERHKPAPDPYLLAAGRLGVTWALVLEDSAAGIASGRAAGFEVLPVERPSEVPELLRQRLGTPGD
ncbi:MAG: HAD family hydrolase [Bryobacteraceae bacterium]